MPAEKIEQVVIDAVAWRVTGGGRLLIDRRRRARVERNMKPVALYLHDVCGVPQGDSSCMLSSTLCITPLHLQANISRIRLAAVRSA